MALIDDLERAAESAAAHAHDSETVTAVLAAEADPGARRYVCALESGAEGAERAWLVVDDAGTVVTSRLEIRDAVTITALCEIAADAAGGGDLDDLLSRLVATRLTESPPGIEEAEEAVRELQVAIGTPPAVATPARLDRIGAAVRHLEQALDPTAGSPFANAMRSAQEAVAELTREVERGYRISLDDS